MMGPEGFRVSQMHLFGSVTSTVRKDMFRRASTSALRRSLVDFNRDELLASMAGIRHISTLRESSRSSSMGDDSSGHSKMDEKKDD